MERDQIADLICKNNDRLIQWLQDHDDEKWESGPKDKWTTGQQALHLLQAVKPINTALSLPRFIVRFKYGKTNRAVRTYEQVVQRYKERLEQAKGATFEPSKNMKPPSLRDKRYLIDRLQMEHKKMEYKTRHISDKNLDDLVLPHPLMGKMPVREMLMWFAYHIEHHYNQLQSSY